MTQKTTRKAVSVRLMPAVMVTVAAVLGLKAVAMAESVAETVAAAGHEEPAAGAEAHAEAATATTAAAQCTAPTLADMAGLSQAEVQVLQALGARRQALDARGEALETQDGLMLAAEQRLNERLAELRTLETHVNDLLGQLDEAQEQRLANLVDVYQRMRAKDAATVSPIEAPGGGNGGAMVGVVGISRTSTDSRARSYSARSRRARFIAFA